MKINKFLMVSLFLLSMNCFSQHSATIGKCTFYYEKNRPSYVNDIGNMTVYHNGDLKKKGIDGKYDLYTCTGTVWVVYNTKKISETTRFIGGNVQTCNNF